MDLKPSLPRGPSKRGSRHEWNTLEKLYKANEGVSLGTWTKNNPRPAKGNPTPGDGVPHELCQVGETSDGAVSKNQRQGQTL